ncbi:MAG TPA: alpha/beta hydrolase [Acidimicrobiales bacterium]|nr:alpha/beta hydrolase [Acidimicrobiales bacterium]
MKAIKLSDGRRLAYEVYGPSDGFVVFHHHGGPGSRLASMAPSALRAAGVRLVVPDRPGFGQSDPLKAPRPISGWSTDLGELADAFSVGRMTVTGFSAGGPFALGAAARLGDRMAAVAVLAGAGELADPEVASTLPAPFDTAVALARDDPGGLRRYLMGQQQPEATLEMIIGRATGADRALYDDPEYLAEFRAAVKEAFAQGPTAYADEFVYLMLPWDFDVASITAPVAFWYGDQDPNPLHQPYMGERLVARMPRASLSVVAGAGAELGRHDATADILRALVALATA